MERLTGLAGIVAFMAIAYALSHKRSAIHWRTIAWGLGLQWIFALIVLKGPALSGLLSFLPFPKGAGWVVLSGLLSTALPTTLAAVFATTILSDQPVGL